MKQNLKVQSGKTENVDGDYSRFCTRVSEGPVQDTDISGLKCHYNVVNLLIMIYINAQLEIMKLVSFK